LAMRRAGGYTAEERHSPSREGDLEGGAPLRQPLVSAPKRTEPLPRSRAETVQILCVIVVVVLLLNAGNLMGVGQYLIHEDGDHEAIEDLRKIEVRDHQEVNKLESTVQSLQDELLRLRSQLKEHESMQEHREKELEVSVIEKEKELEEKLKEDLEAELEAKMGANALTGKDTAVHGEQAQKGDGSSSFADRGDHSIAHPRHLDMPKPIQGVHLRGDGRPCDDRCADDAADCVKRARAGQCASDPAAMEKDCRLACGQCHPCDGPFAHLFVRKALPKQQPRAQIQVQKGTFYVYKESANGPECVEEGQCYHAEAWVARHLFDRGYRRVTRWGEAEFIWTFSAEYGYNMTFIKDTQMVNHVQNTFQLLADKAKLFPTLQSYALRAGCSEKSQPELVPWTADVNDAQQCESLLRHLKSSASHPWLLKPRGGSGGAGIRFFNGNEALLAEVVSRRPEDSDRVACRGFTTGEPDVAQSYISNPLLLQGLHKRKFNLRAYILISSVEPFVAFMHEDGYAGSSMRSYNATGKDLAVHLTGMHTQAHEPSYDGDERVRSWERLAELISRELDLELDEITKGRPVLEWLRERMMRTLLWVLYSGREGYTKKPGSFNAMAVDLLLDSDLKLWVLEVNAYPWMAWETEWGKTWMHGLVDEMIDIQLEIWEKKQTGIPLTSLQAPKKWKVLVNEDSREALFPYAPCLNPL